jgi:hypothetical protein
MRVVGRVFEGAAQASKGQDASGLRGRVSENQIGAHIDQELDEEHEGKHSATARSDLEKETRCKIRTLYEPHI